MHFVEHLEARRLFAAGSLDLDGSRQRPPTPAGQSALHDRKLVLSDGRTIIVGDDQNHWRLRAYLPDGSVDDSFGEDGYLDISRRLASGNARRINFVAEAPDGGLYVGGSGRVRNEKRSEAGGTLIAKVEADGSLDKAFFPKGARDIDRGGFFRLDAPVGSFDFRDVLQVVRGGKLFTGAGNQSNDAMLRDDAGGSANSPFGSGGTAPVMANGMGPQLPKTPGGAVSLSADDDDDEESILYDVSEQSGVIGHLVRVAANGQMFAVKLPPPTGEAVAAAGHSASASEGSTDGKGAPPRAHDGPDAGAMGEVAMDLRDENSDQPGGVTLEVSTRHAEQANESAASRAAGDDATAGDQVDPARLARVIRDDTVIATAAGDQAITAGPVFGALSIEERVIAMGDIVGDDALASSPLVSSSITSPNSLFALLDDSGARVGSPIAGAHGFAWEPVDDASYTIRLLSNRVADVTGALAVGRTIGSFAVRVPDAPLLGTVTAALREKQQKLAPNT